MMFNVDLEVLNREGTESIWVGTAYARSEKKDVFEAHDEAKDRARALIRMGLPMWKPGCVIRICVLSASKEEAEGLERRSS